MDVLINDLRFALRTLARRPAMAAIAILSLALGIGVNVAFFSVLQSIFLRPLATPKAKLLIWGGGSGVTYAQQAALREELALYGEVIGCRPMPLTIGDDSRPIVVEAVTDNYFSAIGLGAHIGRVFQRGDEKAPAGELGIVLSHSLWQRQFGADPGILGQMVQLGYMGRKRVLGVAPRGFRGLVPPMPADVWLVAWAGEASARNPSPWWGLTFVRRPSVSRGTARAVLQSALQRQRGPDPSQRYGSRVWDMQDALRWMLLAVAGLMAIPGIVLLVACANVSGLLAARAEERRPEMAIRLAVGGSRTRLMRQLLTEGTLLALAGTTAGVVLAGWILAYVGPWLRSTLGPYMVVPEPTIDARTLIVALALAIVAAVASSLLPALTASRPDLGPILKRETRVLGHGRLRFTMRDALVVGQLVVTFAAIVSALVCVRGTWRVVAAPLGFDPSRLLVAHVWLTNELRRPAVLDSLRADVERLSGVRRVALATAAPGLSEPETTVHLPAGQNRESSPAVKAGHGAISPNGFEMTGVRLLRGRLPTEADERLDARVAVVSRTLAERLFGDRNPLGQPILVGDSTADAIEIVGVVSDPTQVATVEQPLRGRAGHPFLYRPLSAAFLSSQTGAALLIEGTSDAAKLGPAVDRVVRGRRSEVLTRATVAEMVRRGLAQYEIVTVVVLILGGLCVALGLIGLYGTIAYAVERRTQEIGVRIAIGASSGQVVRLVLRGGLVRSGVAILLGLPLAYGFHRGLVAIVFDLPSLNAATLAATASLVVLASSLACLLPARRAARVDPIEALRCE